MSRSGQRIQIIAPPAAVPGHERQQRRRQLPGPGDRPHTSWPPRNDSPSIQVIDTAWLAHGAGAPWNSERDTLQGFAGTEFTKPAV